MKREHQDSSGYSGAEMGKGKMMAPEAAAAAKEDEEVDELLAALGYKVRSSDMADVAQKLEQLEMAMAIGGAGGLGANDDGFLSQLACDTVHYNPSDLSTWLESMLSELNAPPPPLPSPPRPSGGSGSYYFDPPSAAAAVAIAPSLLIDPAESSTVTTVADFHQTAPPRASSQHDLKPMPPSAADPAIGSDQAIDVTRERKRMRTGNSSSSSSSSSLGSGKAPGAIGPCGSAVAEAAAPAVPVVMVDPQEVGIRLVHALMACAEAVQQENLKAADILVKQISVLAASQGGAMRKVASFFAEALARRIYGLRPQPAPFGDLLHLHFYESCPYLKFAHFTANQAILEAFAGCRRVHVVDFGIKQGMQWPALLQALALRPGGPPSFRLTGVGPPQPDDSDALQQVGWKLAQFAHTVGVEFQYRGLVAASLADLEPYLLRPAASSDGAADGSEAEAVAVNSVCELHRLLAQPGDLEKVLGTVRAVRPRIFTVVEQEANHNAGQFMERFTEALHYYSTLFDSLEASAAGVAAGAGTDQVMAEVYLGRQICNVVACEGAERTERHETLAQWRGRLGRAGFEPVHLGSNAFKQASTLLALFAGGDGYRVEEQDGCLTLGWHTRPLIVTFAWRAAAA